MTERGAQAPTTPGGITAPSGEGRARASFQQQPLWVVDRLHGGTRVQHVPGWLRIRGKVDVTLLDQALAWLLERHDVLRTAYRREGNELFRVDVAPKTALEHRAGADGAQYNESRRTEHVRSIVAERLDPERGSVMRVVLVRYEETDHDLVVALHPIAADREAMQVALVELASNYERLRGGHGRHAEPVATYGGYASSQSLPGVVARHCRRAAEALQDLPDERWFVPTSRPESSTTVHGVQTRAVPSDLALRVREKAEMLEVKPQAIWFASILALGHRLSGQIQLTLGVPMSLRRGDYALTVGNFVNGVPFASTYDPQQSFAAFARACAGWLEAARERAELPLEELLHALQARGRSAPTVRVFASFDDFSSVSLPPGWELKRCASSEFGEADLHFRVEGRNGRFFVDLHHRAHVFDAAYGEDLVDRLLWLTETFVSDPGQRLADVPLIRPVEHQELLALGRGVQELRPDGEGVLHAVTRQVTLWPSATAVIGTDEELSYNVLWERAEAFACVLVQSGVGPGDVVGVELRPDAQLAVAWLGIVRAGAVLLSVDPRVAETDLHAALERMSVRWIVSDPTRRRHWSHLKYEVLTVGSTVRQVDAVSTRSLPMQADPACYVFDAQAPRASGADFAAVTHFDLVNQAQAMRRVLQLRSGVRTMFSAEPGSAVSLLEFFPTFAAGGTVVFRPSLASSEQGSAPDNETCLRVLETAEEQEVELLFFSVDTWQTLVEGMARLGWRLPASVRTVAVYGGRALPSSVAQWRAVTSNVQLLHLYGVAEAGLVSTSYDANEGLMDGELPIGRPLPNQGACVLSRFGDVLPRSTVGELWLTRAPHEDAVRTRDYAYWHRNGTLVLSEPVASRTLVSKSRATTKVAEPLVAPRDPTELALAEIWRDVLSLERVGVKQNFFSIGGHSSAAIVVIDRANASGLTVSTRDFLDDPTIAGLARAAHARAERDAMFDVLVPLDARGVGAPVVFFHALEGELLRYGRVVHQLGTQRPCFGLQALGMRYPERAHRTVGSLAASYAQRLAKACQGRAPHLVGWRFGGTLAVETCRELARMQHPVGSVAVVDSVPSVHGVEGLVRLAQQARASLASLRARSTHGALDPDTKFALEARSGPFAHRAKVREIHREALRHHHTRPLAGELLVIRGDGTGVGAENDYGWGRIVDACVVMQLDTDARGLLKQPHAATVAGILNRWFDRNDPHEAKE